MASEIELIERAFSAQRLSKYRHQHPDDEDMVVKVLGWMNKDMPSWLNDIDRFDSVCDGIRKELGK